MKTTAPTPTPLCYSIEATEPRLTGYGGAGLLARFLQQLHLPQSFAALPGLPQTRKAPPAQVLVAMLYGLVLDRSRQAHLADLGADPVFLQFAGLEGILSQSALSRFLSRLRMPTAHAVLELNRTLVAGARQGFADWPTLTFDVDSHVQTCLSRPQRSAVGFNRRRRGARSYHPLFAFCGETRDFLGGRFRPGNAADRTGALALLDELRRWLKRSGFCGRLQFRGDNGFYAGWLLDALEQRDAGYAIVADLAGEGLQRRLVGLEYRPLDGEYAVAEFQYRAQGWKQARRMIAVRRRLDPKEPKRGKQLKLLEAEGYSFQLIVTNLALAPEEVWRFYNGRCNVENLIKEGRLGFSMDEVCSHAYAANALHNWLALLAGNPPEADWASASSCPGASPSPVCASVCCASPHGWCTPPTAGPSSSPCTTPTWRSFVARISACAPETASSEPAPTAPTPAPGPAALAPSRPHRPLHTLDTPHLPQSRPVCAPSVCTSPPPAPNIELVACYHAPDSNATHNLGLSGRFRK